MFCGEDVGKKKIEYTRCFAGEWPLFYRAIDFQPRELELHGKARASSPRANRHPPRDHHYTTKNRALSPFRDTR